jgi:hypothetical protein
MQLAPRFLARFPYSFPKGSPGILQRHDEQTGPQIFAVAMKGWRTLSVIHLGFFTHQEFQPVILPGIFPFEPSYKPLYAVVAVCETEQLHQVLVDGHTIAAQSQLFLDPLPMRFTCGTNMLGQVLSRNRWPGWGILHGRLPGPGGHTLMSGGF